MKAALKVFVISQLGASTKPLFLSAAVCAGLSVVPGLPFLPFITLGVFALVMGIIRGNALKLGAKDLLKLGGSEEKSDKPKPGSTEEVTGLLGVATLELEVGYELVSMVEGGDLVERIRSIRRQFALDYGFIVAPVHIRDNVRLKPAEYRLLLKGAVIGSGELKSNHLLAMDPGNVTTPMEGTKTKEPAFGLDALWVTETDKERAQFSGYTVVDLPTVVTTHITELVRAHMHELIGRQETQHLLDNLAKEFPKVVEELVPGLLTVGQVQQVLGNLLREQVSIRDLRSILETLADWAPNVKQPEKLAEFARRKLSRVITAKYATTEGVLPLASLTPSVERMLSDSVQQSDEGSFLALEPGYAQSLITRLSKVAEKFVEMGQTPLLLAPSHLRRD